MKLACLALIAFVCAALANAENGEGRLVFHEVAEEAGVDFVHRNGMRGNRWLVEIMGSGVGLLDFDNDGLLDLWLVQSGSLLESGDARARDQLYRNVSTGGRLRFENVTAKSGVVAERYGMGIATSDVDRDGDLDVFLANYGVNQLFSNLGDGRFREVGTFTESEWSIGASFADVDGDGWDDLYVVNYVDFTLDNHRVCHDLAGRASYCTPEIYAATADRLFRNLRGDGFEDVTSASVIGAKRGSGLGVVAHDFNNDDRVDFYVANDAVDNHLWINQGGRRFIDRALLSGVAVNGDGKPEASMGVDAEDFDGDCDIDLFVTHLAAETNTLYVNEGDWFADRSNVTGVGASSAPFTGFGTGWFDADNDGDMDLFSANGAVTDLADQAAQGEPLPLRQRNQIWVNDDSGYLEVSGGPAFELVEVSRGAAFGDLDNDGDLDVVVTNNNGPARILRNDTAGGAWLGIALEGNSTAGSNVRLASSPCRSRRVATDGSYASANDPRVIFGLGAETAPQSVHVRWPDGLEEAFGPYELDRYHTLRRGSGAPLR